MNFELFIVQVMAHALVTAPLAGGGIALAIHLATEVCALRQRGWGRQRGLEAPAARDAAPEPARSVQRSPAARRDAAEAVPVRMPAPASAVAALAPQRRQHGLAPRHARREFGTRFGSGSAAWRPGPLVERPAMP